MIFSDEQTKAGLKKALETRKRNKAEREAKTEVLEGGAKVYPDSLPGIGWVLELLNSHKCYMGTREKVVELWVQKYSKVDYKVKTKKAP